MAPENSHIRVLFVDSSEGYVDEARRYLDKHQPERIETIWYKVGEEAIDYLKNNTDNIDIILTDYFLPIADGLEITRMVREITAKIPVIFLTSSKELKVAVEAMKIGADEFLVKEEIGMDILARTIINTLKRSQLRDQMEKIGKRQLMAEKQTDAIKALIVTICHEFNNPLAAIKISIDVLQRQSLSEQEKSHIQKLEDQVHIIEKKINQLRDLKFEKKHYSNL